MSKNVDASRHLPMFTPPYALWYKKFSRFLAMKDNKTLVKVLDRANEPGDPPPRMPRARTWAK